jgi:predicted molibdopterin-dependent oxidoreductase YjgC
MSAKIIVDDKELTCKLGEKVLEVALRNGFKIPTLCYNALYDENRSGACRLCIVEVTGGGRPGLYSSCTLPVNNGLMVSTKSEAVFQARRTVVELLLSEHTQDCRNCPISGACNFAEYCREYDLNGVPVCAECPNQKEGCLLSRGVLCLGPITFANCEAYCTKRGYKCEGCHSAVGHEAVIKFGLQAFLNAGIRPEEVLEATKVFNFDGVKLIEKVMHSMGIVPGEGV